MSLLLSIFSVVVFTCLLLAVAMRPLDSNLSLDELKRRRKASPAYDIELKRRYSRGAIEFLLSIVQILLILILSWLLVGLWGWSWGIAASLGVVLTHTLVARLPFIRRGSRVLYARFEPELIEFATKFKKPIYFLGQYTGSDSVVERKAQSLEDLADIIDNSKEVIGARERQAIISTLDFFDKPVSEIMIPRTKIDFIKHSEFLGPLVLDELHLLGHSQLPVVGRDLDDIVGILDLESILSLDVKRSVTAEKAMNKKVIYADRSDQLEAVLNSLVANNSTIAVVRNDKAETVGLVTLEDVIGALIGRSISTDDDNLLK